MEEALFQQYSKNDELLFDFVTVIAFISGSTRTIVGTDHLYQHFHSSVLSNHNNRIEDFAKCQAGFEFKGLTSNCNNHHYWFDSNTSDSSIRSFSSTVVKHLEESHI